MSKPKRREHRANRVTLRSTGTAPRKVRMVADLVRGKDVDDALTLLQFTPKKAAPVLAKLIESAVYNVEESGELDWDVDDLFVSEIFVDEGPTMRRFRPRAMGRATRINKRTSHITVVLRPR